MFSEWFNSGPVYQWFVHRLNVALEVARHPGGKPRTDWCVLWLQPPPIQGQLIWTWNDIPHHNNSGVVLAIALQEIESNSWDSHINKHLTANEFPQSVKNNFDPVTGRLPLGPVAFGIVLPKVGGVINSLSPLCRVTAAMPSQHKTRSYVSKKERASKIKWVPCQKWHPVKRGSSHEACYEHQRSGMTTHHPNFLLQIEKKKKQKKTNPPTDRRDGGPLHPFEMSVWPAASNATPGRPRTSIQRK